MKAQPQENASLLLDKIAEELHKIFFSAFNSSRGDGTEI